MNPSYEITKSLPKFLPPTEAHPVGVRILDYGSSIRVDYEGVRDLVPMLHKTYAGTVDIVLHIGMASGRKHYTIERYGHRDGYEKNKDLDGLVPTGDTLSCFADCPATLTTSLDYVGILQRWQDSVRRTNTDKITINKEELQSSEDAGNFLCDYIYFNSLAWFGRRSQVFDGPPSAHRPVLFLHVPADSSEDGLERGRLVTVGLIRAMADGWAVGEEPGYKAATPAG